jgi:hypothetical protein
VVNLSRSK